MPAVNQSYTSYLRVMEEADRRRMQFDRLTAEADPATAARLDTMTQRYGGYARPDVIQALGLSGADPYSPVTTEVARRSGQARVRKGEAIQPGERVNGNRLTRLARTGVRGTFSILQGLYHELAARPIMSAATLFDGDPETTFGEAYSRIGPAAYTRGIQEKLEGSDPSIYGEESHLGTGWLPAGELTEDYEQEVARAAAYLGTGDQASPGRSVASIFMEPGNQAFNVTSGLLDVALNIYADPTVYASKGVGIVRHAAKALDSPEDVARFLPQLADEGSDVVKALDNARLRGPRHTVDVRQAEHAVTGTPGGRKLVDWLTSETSPDRIRRGTRGARFDVATSKRLADARTPTDTVEVLRNVLGTAVRTKPSAPRQGFDIAGKPVLPTVRRKIERVRILRDMPGRKVDLDDPDQAVGTLDDYWRNARLPDEVVTSLNDKAIGISPDDPERVGKFWELLSDGMTEIVRHQPGKLRPSRDDRAMRKIRQIIDDYNPELRSYVEDEVGRPISYPGLRETTTVNGRQVVKPSAFLLSQYARQGIPLPDPREIRRATSMFGRLMEIPGVDLSVGLLEAGMAWWKKTLIARPALTARTLGDEQARMAASGYASAFSHPFSYIAWMTGRGKTSFRTDDLGQVDEFIESMSKGTSIYHKGSRVPGEVNLKEFVPYRRGDANFERAWGSRLAQLATDDIAQRVAGGFRPGDVYDHSKTGLDAAKDWFVRGSGKRMWDRFDSRMRGVFEEDSTKAEAYIDTVWRFINAQTGGKADLSRLGDTELIEGIAKGKILDIDVFQKDWRQERIAGQVQKALREKQGSAPDLVHGDRSLAIHGDQGEVLKRNQRLDHVTDIIFNTLLSRPTDWASRSPVFRQEFWREGERLLPFMTREAQEQMLKGAETAKLGGKTLKRMKATVGKGSGDKITDLFEAELLAGNKAKTEVRKLLYDVHRRGQFADVVRILAPFADPWKEILTTWGRLVAQDPGRVVRRGQQLVEGARTSGFFYTDENNQERFAYPGSGQFLAALGFGEDRTSTRFTGRPTGLNLALGELLPGFGPLVTYPLSSLIPEKPSHDGLRNLLLPFGREDTADLPFALLPAWMQKLVSGGRADPEDDRLFASTVMDQMNQLYAEGGFGDPESGMLAQEDLLGLETEAKRRARLLLMLRGAAQAVLPTGPEIEYRAVLSEAEAGELRKLGIDPGEHEDRVVRFGVIAQAMQVLQEEDYENAGQRFIDMFGVDLTMLTRGKTREIQSRSLDTVGATWEREHPELTAAFPNVIGEFAPVDPTAPFDYDAMESAISMGARKNLSPTERVWLHNNALGWTAYERAAVILEGQGLDPDSDQARAEMSVVRARLKSMFPGFDASEMIGGRVDVDQSIIDLRKASQDSVLARTPQGQAAQSYFELRDGLEQVARERLDTNLLTGKRATGLRAELRRAADDLIIAYPEFAALWDKFFARELTEDEEVSGPVGGGGTLNRGGTLGGGGIRQSASLANRMTLNHQPFFATSG